MRRNSTIFSAAAPPTIKASFSTGVLAISLDVGPFGSRFEILLEQRSKCTAACGQVSSNLIASFMRTTAAVSPYRHCYFNHFCRCNGSSKMAHSLPQGFEAVSRQAIGPPPTTIIHSPGRQLAHSTFVADLSSLHHMNRTPRKGPRRKSVAQNAPSTWKSSPGVRISTYATEKALT